MTPGYANSLMALTCGWPHGNTEEQGFCGCPGSVVFLVRVQDVPLGEEDVGHLAALVLCPEHDPLQTSDRFR